MNNRTRIFFYGIAAFILGNINPAAAQNPKGNGYELPFNVVVATSRAGTTILQKDAEMLAGGGLYSFDGMKLVNLNLSYLDFAKGSHRGTFYSGVNLRNSIGVKKALGESDNDLTSTTFGTGTKLINTRFRNWRIQDSWFTGCTIDSSSLVNTIMENTTFTDVTLKNTTITHNRESFWNNVLFKGRSVSDGLVIDKGRLFNTSFAGMTMTNSRITNSNINSWRCTGSTANPVKFIGMRFDSDSILNMNLVSTTLAGTDSINNLSVFENCYLSTLNFQTCQIGAEFTNTKWKLGYVVNTHFLKSVFNRLQVTGGADPSQQVVFNNCNFSRSRFDGEVVFTYCNFTNCRWPAGPKPANVQFVNCTGTVWQ